eukprot:PLAT3018.1.p1 GENE.PLAT3018.1~~PLAT3018.1.p1  ORF type:complete len:164 (-),score=51.56 PLAT3018.1:49-489(-)
MASPLLFEDLFDVKRVNPDGKVFDRVSRVIAKGMTYENALTVDIHSELFPLREGDKVSMALASTLSLEGKPDDGRFDQSGLPSLMDGYEYCMHGKVYDYLHEAGRKVSIYISFGGLLMLLQGEQRNLMGIKPDMALYCLMRRTSRA